MTVASAQPPQMAPQKLPVTKLRSHTSAAITDVPIPHILQQSHSVDLQPTRKNSFDQQSRGPSLPKTKPITASPPDSRKLDHSHSSQELKFGSPPPPPPPRRVNSQANGLASPQHFSVPNDYGLLAEATSTPLGQLCYLDSLDLIFCIFQTKQKVNFDVMNKRLSLAYIVVFVLYL